MNISKLSAAGKSLTAAVAVLLLTACLDNSSDSDTDEDFLQVISTQNHGNILADEEENVLYFFVLDVKGESKCQDDCIANWPEFHTEQFIIGGGLDEQSINQINRPDGSLQTTYKGWPLYYFSGDQPGEVNGDGANGLWYVAKPDNSLMIAREQLVGADGNNYTSDYEEGEEITTYFTDAEGNTLYIFVFDEANTNNFTEEDFSNNEVWPIFHTEIEALPSGMNEEDFGEIMVHGEQPQLTYKGWPLYTFGQDTQRGDTQGVSVPEPGIWPVVNSDVSPAP